MNVCCIGKFFDRKQKPEDVATQKFYKKFLKRTPRGDNFIYKTNIKGLKSSCLDHDALFSLNENQFHVKSFLSRFRDLILFDNAIRVLINGYLKQFQ